MTLRPSAARARLLVAAAMFHLANATHEQWPASPPASPPVTYIGTQWTITDVDCSDSAALTTACDDLKTQYVSATGYDVESITVQCTCCDQDKRGKWRKKKCAKKTSKKKSKACKKKKIASKCAATCCGSL